MIWVEFQSKKLKLKSNEHCDSLQYILLHIDLYVALILFLRMAMQKCDSLSTLGGTNTQDIFAFKTYIHFLINYSTFNTFFAILKQYFEEIARVAIPQLLEVLRV